jgi:hypothetical protein
VKLNGRTYLLAAALSFAGFFINDYLHIIQRNSTRKRALTDAATTAGKVTRVDQESNFNGIHHPARENYEFQVNDKWYHGATMFNHDNKTGDTICVIFNKSKPLQNICCDERIFESVNGESFLGHIVATVMVLVLMFFIDLFKYATREKFVKVR